MARYTIDFTEEKGAEVNLGPGVPVPKSVDFSFEANTEAELRQLVDALGFDAAELNPTKDLHVRYSVPMTRDGREVGSATLYLWIGEGLAERRPPAPPIAALQALRDEAVAARRQAELSEGAPMGYPQSVELRDGEAVSDG